MPDSSLNTAGIRPGAKYSTNTSTVVMDEYEYGYIAKS